jgi:hypothetical protein
VLPTAAEEAQPATAAATMTAQLMVRTKEFRLWTVAAERTRGCTDCPSGGAMPYNPTGSAAMPTDIRNKDRKAGTKTKLLCPQVTRTE